MSLEEFLLSLRILIKVSESKIVSGSEFANVAKIFFSISTI